MDSSNSIYLLIDGQMHSTQSLVLEKNCAQASICISRGILKIFHHFELVMCESHVFGLRACSSLPSDRIHFFFCSESCTLYLVYFCMDELENVLAISVLMFHLREYRFDLYVTKLCIYLLFFRPAAEISLIEIAHQWQFLWSKNLYLSKKWPQGVMEGIYSLKTAVRVTTTQLPPMGHHLKDRVLYIFKYNNICYKKDTTFLTFIYHKI